MSIELRHPEFPDRKPVIVKTDGQADVYAKSGWVRVDADDAPVDGLPAPAVVDAPSPRGRAVPSAEPAPSPEA